jgi:hypothetical protein
VKGPVEEHPYLTFGPANDGVSIAVLALGTLLLLLAILRGRELALAVDRIRTRWLVAALAVGATGLSSLYVVHYLGGGPRIIDAAAYWLEARVLSTGQLAFDVPEPSGSFRGRFLLPTPDGRLSVIFPPGYPLLLAGGFLAGVPLFVGPLVAGLLVIATYATARTLLGDERAARTAAVVSLLCAALRYHTADTMSHGLSALLFVAALGAAAKRTRRSVVIAGLLVGWLAATRPVTGAVALVVVVVALGRSRTLLPVLALGMIPGLALIANHARVATGSWFGSTQLAYYALSDGPPGCFRYGFGDGIGCRFEHGDFVNEHLQQGFGALEASWITLERLALHGIDVANLFPLVLLVPWAAFRFRNEPGVRVLALAPVLIVLAYAPFYYPGSYPGAGARLFADVLPLEHALLGLALTRFRIARFAPAAMLLGFALHAAQQHRALAEREGGKPMFASSALGNVDRGLVFVSTDHGFLLGHDPRSRDAHRTLVVARRRDDAHDWILWERLGRPPAYRYDYDVLRGTTAVTAVRPDELPARFEGEAEWPPLAVSSGWAHPDYRECLSGGQGLHLRGTSGASAAIEVVPPTPGRYELTLGWLADPQTEIELGVNGSRIALVGSRDGQERRGTCFSARAGSMELTGPTRVDLRVRQDAIVDYLGLTSADAKKR